MLHKSNFTSLLIIIALFTASAIIAQDKPMHMHMKEMKTEKQSSDSNIVRKSAIDLKSIDKNNDGKVYQCPMDLNVISDIKNDCPECGMMLREITIDDAKTKLLKKGFELKETNMKDHMKTVPKGDEKVQKIWNKVCPVTGEEVDSEAPTAEYKDKIIGFCCPGCEKKFQKDAEKYMKKLCDDGTKLLSE